MLVEAQTHQPTTLVERLAVLQVCSVGSEPVHHDMRESSLNFINLLDAILAS